jgi:hypothetical protein
LLLGFENYKGSVTYDHYCMHFFQQINNITKSSKLKSLFLHKMLQIELFEPLIQKFCVYLENFGAETQQLLQLTIKYCNKIK